jgi:hypothetical protein
MGHMRLYVYRRPNTMKNHEYTDDVAITYAMNLTEAKDKFRTLYNVDSHGDIEEINFNDYGVAILTDY